MYTSLWYLGSNFLASPTFACKGDFKRTTVPGLKFVVAVPLSYLFLYFSWYSFSLSLAILCMIFSFSTNCLTYSSAVTDPVLDCSLLDPIPRPQEVPSPFQIPSYMDCGGYSLPRQ